MNILLIEDDPRIADFLSRGFQAEGHRVSVASDGLQGLEAARQVARDQRTESGQTTILILDLMLPSMGGIEICQTLRAEGFGLPILMLSALATVESRVAGLRLGADDYLPKPFDFEELLVRLECLARRGREHRNSTPNLLQVDNLVFDRLRMQASRNGRAIALTAKELALLELMMSAPGRLFSRERILANVWGASEDPLTNIVEVYIRRLRSKIDMGTDKPLILTVRGLGYRMES